MSNIRTTTISLPKALAERARQLSREESRTMSELFREALRSYERTRQNRVGYTARGGKLSWPALRQSLKRVSRSGRTTNLAEFVTRDRLSH